MRLRNIWIIPMNKDAEFPLFSRCFPTVEACCKTMSGDVYVGIPPDDSFVKALRLEVGLDDAGIFVESRDKCNKSSLYPTFEVTLDENKILWPVVVLENRGFIYCALPLVPKEMYTRDRSDVSLADLPGVSVAIEALNGLAQCVPLHSSMTSLTPALTLQLHQYVSTCMPFGNVTCSNPSLLPQLLNPHGKGKSKQPLWNPVPHKGRSQVVIHIKEEVRCMQFNHTELKDAMDVYGTVMCKAEVEGIAPEISITLVQPGGNDQNINGGGLVVSPAVSNTEYTATTARLRFRPCNNQPLCHYTLPHITEPPIHGAFKLTVSSNLVTMYVQLQLQAGIKNSFQQLEVHIPFLGFQISSIKPNPSIGSVSLQSGNMLVWNVGNKFPSRSLDATLSGVCKLHKYRRKGEGSSDQPAENADAVAWEQQVNSYALVLFKLADYTFSGTRVDPQSVIVSTAPKIRCSITSECVSGQYKIWNSEGEVPAVGEMPVEELKKLLLQ